MPVLRTFVAIDLSDELRHSLGQVQELLARQAPRRSIRWVRPEGIHLTLKFLGDTSPEQVKKVKAALTLAAAEVEPFTLLAVGLGCFPNNRQPRVIWIGLLEPSGALVRVQQAVEAHIAPLGFPTEKRPISPHLTLGRMQRQASRSDVQAVGRIVTDFEVGTLGQMRATSVCYIKSDLEPGGAVYTTLLKTPLGGS